MNANGGATLRERQTAATREEILDAAMEILSGGAVDGFSHESIAKTAGIGARTVYRHFPDRGQLLEALWVRLRDETNTRFPTRQEEIISFARSAFREFDEHEALIRAVLSSSAGTEVRERGGAEGRPAFARSLERLVKPLDPTERAKMIAIFVAIYSAPFWQLLRDRGGLSGAQAQDAVSWLLGVLIDGLQETNSSKLHRRKESEPATGEKQKNERPRR